MQSTVQNDARAGANAVNDQSNTHIGATSALDRSCTGPTISGVLGARVRHARLLQGLTLKEVGRRAQCSESAVSKVERNLVAPSLAMLHRLASALGTNISNLTADEWRPSGPVLRAGARPVQGFRQGEQNGVTLERLTGAMRGGLLQANIHLIPPRTKSDGLIEHRGEEVGYVLEGSVRLQLGEDSYQLEVGDSFHFASQIPHGYENTGEHIARILWINTPATF